MKRGVKDDASETQGPQSVRELLRCYAAGRITGWDPANPPDVEKAFRIGYLIGASRCRSGDLEVAADLEQRLHQRRGDLYHTRESWTDRRAALLRGAHHGALDMVRARADGVNTRLRGWLRRLRTWAHENPPRLAWTNAVPPEPPKPDSPPLGRDGVPQRLWGQVFGAFMLIAPLGDVAPRKRGPFIETQEQFEQLLAQQQRMQAERYSEMGNLEKLLQPKLVDEHAPTSTVAPPTAERWPEPKAVADFDCPDSLEWIWEGWVAVAHITALVAKWKAGKTTLLHHLLCAREAGGDIGGAITAGPTLVISEEHPTLWRKRSVSKRIGDHVKFICLPLITNIREWFEFTEYVQQLVDRDGYSLVVYDTLPGLAPIQDENANSQMLAILRPLLSLKDVGTGTILITHPPKGDTGDDFNVRGASALMGFADQLAALKRPEGDATSTQRILKCVGRLGEPLEQVIELRGNDYVTLGTKLDIAVAGRRATLQKILPPEPPGLTVDEIITQWPSDQKKPTARTLRRFLKDWLNKAGAGTKDDPVRHWW